MKTKTQEQLEKEIEYIENFPEEKDQTLGDFECKGCGVELNISERDKGDYCINCLKTKLSQHKTDIKNFEKLIDKENIYPTDIFPEIDEELFEEINQELQNKFEFPLDRLSAQICRKILGNQREALKNL